MKKLAVAAVAALCLTLSGCTGTSLTEVVKQVQDKAVELCNYRPDPVAVAAMLTAANPTFVGYYAVANAICTAVIQWQNQPKNSITSECPKVNGICVTGSFQTPKGN